MLPECGLSDDGVSALFLQHSAAQHSAAQHSTAQRIAAQRGTAQHTPFDDIFFGEAKCCSRLLNTSGYATLTCLASLTVLIHYTKEKFRTRTCCAVHSSCLASSTAASAPAVAAVSSVAFSVKDFSKHHDHSEVTLGSVLQGNSSASLWVCIEVAGVLLACSTHEVIRLVPTNFGQQQPGVSFCPLRSSRLKVCSLSCFRYNRRLHNTLS